MPQQGQQQEQQQANLPASVTSNSENMRTEPQTQSKNTSQVAGATIMNSPQMNQQSMPHVQDRQQVGTATQHPPAEAPGPSFQNRQPGQSPYFSWLNRMGPPSQIQTTPSRMLLPPIYTPLTFPPTTFPPTTLSGGPQPSSPSGPAKIIALQERQIFLMNTIIHNVESIHTMESMQQHQANVGGPDPIFTWRLTAMRAELAHRKALLAKVAAETASVKSQQGVYGKDVSHVPGVGQQAVGELQERHDSLKSTIAQATQFAPMHGIPSSLMHIRQMRADLVSRKIQHAQMSASITSIKSRRGTPRASTPAVPGPSKPRTLQERKLSLPDINDLMLPRTIEPYGGPRLDRAGPTLGTIIQHFYHPDPSIQAMLDFQRRGATCGTAPPLQSSPMLAPRQPGSENRGTLTPTMAAEMSPAMGRLTPRGVSEGHMYVQSRFIRYCTQHSDTVHRTSIAPLPSQSSHTPQESQSQGGETGTCKQEED
ncbi:hypothetical protein BV22DRAFT_370206 [Leucogyrophana mollusca]|uniref:Uncharacterized protein n=1 Tax=Leucogyrophana mollusca TaxID=85980 RepID=A0ACB8BLR3_9AGAM|nr:hypothetical protein BV22DRAFT_370206 [Leucogyrophana mollusca]